MKNIFFMVSFFLSLVAYGETYQYQGLIKTKPYVIQTEIDLCECSDNTEKLKNQILSTQLFYDVEINKLSSQDPTIVQLNEKWTTIPIAKFNSGGGVQQTTLGLYDPHVFGRRIELGAQYEKIQTADSTVFWNKVPRLLETRFFSDLQIWNTQRIRLKYDQTQNKPILTKALLLKSNRPYFSLGYEFKNNLKLSLSAEKQKDQFSADLISEETLNLVTGQVIPEDTDYMLYGVQIEHSRIETVNDTPLGHSIKLGYKKAVSQQSAQDDFNQFKLEAVHFTELSKISPDLTFNQRFQIGLTDTSVIQFFNYNGGLESIRGFVDNRFSSKKYWLLNNEFRYLAFKNNFLVFQLSTFADLLGLEADNKKLEDLNAASIGVGSRFIFPKIYRLILRVDIAEQVTNKDNQTLSFGIQQYF